MNRCFGARRVFSLFLALAGLWLSLPSYSQGIVREAPKDVVLALMVVTAPPEITLNGLPDRLSPGSRIRDLNNMLVLSGGIVGKTLPVVYRRDAAGLVHEAWILSADEYTKLKGADPTSGPNGAKRFAELLSLIFGTR
jgi:hypothetical protein